MGTSINTGSDKQTYYKLGLYAQNNDSPEALAATFFNGASMHGDLALVEASLSARAFFNLVNLGVPFPRDEFGQYIGYKADHYPLRRATSCGPYPSKEMCMALIKEVINRNIKVYENRVAVSLLTVDENGEKRACGAIAINRNNNEKPEFEVFTAENVIFAVGGPGSIYKTSVYPNVHTGAIGLALKVGAKAQRLPESQYGLASIKFRWNVSGTYMQFVSTSPDGKSDPQEFLRPYFKTVGDMNSMIFLKGYQWPFDSRKAAGGSSIIDILVYIETVLKGRRVYLDFRENGAELDFAELNSEAYEYLEKSDTLFGTPFERLQKMNPGAITLYEDHNIHLVNEPLEIAVCAQHNNGGLAGNLWGESLNIKHLFPIGEVNGSHGVYRPGGSALNSGQAGTFRASEFITAKYAEDSLNTTAAQETAEQSIAELQELLDNTEKQNWQTEREESQLRMRSGGTHIRDAKLLNTAVAGAWRQVERLNTLGVPTDNIDDTAEALQNRQLCLAHAVYLDATLQQVKDGVGSRGSALTIDPDGQKCHDQLNDEWRFQLENQDFRDKVMESELSVPGKIIHQWIKRRSMPHSDGWFENVWADFREKKIYSQED